jgi:4-hydroxybutyrate CoA-transferase
MKIRSRDSYTYKIHNAAHKLTSAEQAVKLIKSGDHVYVHGGVATPQTLLQAMVNRSDELENVYIHHIHTEGFADYADQKYKGIFKSRVFFIGNNMRKAIDIGRAQYIPVFLSEIPQLVRQEILPTDVALINVSPPDIHGYCSLGATVVEMVAVIEKAKTVIAQINPHMPRTHGDGLVHLRNFDAMVEVYDPIISFEAPEPNQIEKKIGEQIASLVEDGATLQMGIGGIPNAALLALKDHKNLGVHTEMFSDGVIELVKRGVINNRLKKVHPHKIVSTFAMGSDNLYAFIDDNPEINLIDCAFTNDLSVIRQNPKVTAINSAIEVDMTGQVCADSIGTRMYSGVGGQMDFIRGAALSPGGKPIIALPSTTKRGDSKIVSTLRPGAGVVTTRAHVRYIVTEYGIADLYGKTLRQRAKAMIEIAHPDHREALDQAAFERFGLKNS